MQLGDDACRLNSQDVNATQAAHDDVQLLASEAGESPHFAEQLLEHGSQALISTGGICCCCAGIACRRVGCCLSILDQLLQARL